MPWSCTRRCSAATTCSAACGSSWLVGSSRTRMRGPAAIAAAIATRWRSPPRQRSHAPVAQRLDVEQVEHLLDAPAHVRGWHAQVLHAVGELVLDAVEHERGRRDPAGRTPPRRRGGAARARACRARPTSTRPENVPPVKWGTSPFAARRNVDLPAPVGPTTRTNVPSSMTSVTSASAGTRRVRIRNETRQKRRASALTAAPPRRGRGRGRTPGSASSSTAARSHGSAAATAAATSTAAVRPAGPGGHEERAGRDERRGDHDRDRAGRPAVRPVPRAAPASVPARVHRLGERHRVLHPGLEDGTARAGSDRQPRDAGCRAAAAPRARGRRSRSCGARSTARAPPPARARGSGAARGARRPRDR